jgi:pimeloyl-ACP methyl ester carboxylesterase
MRFDLALAAWLLSGPALAQVSLEEATAGFDLEPCASSSLACTTLTLPLDHRANDPGQTIGITFALSFASIESRGILFFFVGGPGGSGLASAENYLASFDESLIQYTDIVFFDQRGTGPDHGLSCPLAQAAFDQADISLTDPEAATRTARRFAEDCVAEMDAGPLLALVDTDQAIRDVEAFRQRLGAPQVWLYGESYGTQFVQAYATQVPQAVRGVILDGVVDLTLDASGFYTRYTLASEALLLRMFADCAALPACAADMGRDPAAVYDDLAVRLAQAPLPVDYALPDGSTASRALTQAMLESNAFFALYGQDGRSGFLRALAAAERGDLIPMLDLGYANLYIDPVSETGIQDPGWFPAAYFSITCTDYDSGAGTPDERAARIIAEAKALVPDLPRLARWQFAERLVCAFWPHQGPAIRPAPFAGGDWPTFVLNGDGDPITPISMAYDVLDRAQNAYGLFMKGGPHVIWGRGYGCPDEILLDYLIDDTLPPVREQFCEQEFLGPYTPLTLTTPEDRADPLAVAQAVATELTQSIPLAGWDWQDPMTIGCPLGGILTVELADEGTRHRLTDCLFWPGLGASGTVLVRDLGDDNDGLSIDLAISGDHAGRILYDYNNRTEASHLSGTWDGQRISAPRLKP